MLPGLCRGPRPLRYQYKFGAQISSRIDAHLSLTDRISTTTLDGDAAVADGIASRTFRMLLTNHSRRRTRSRCSSRRRVGRVLLFEAEQKAGLRPINTATLHPTSHHSPFCHTNFETEPPSPTRRSRASEPFEAVMGIHSSSIQFKSSPAWRRTVQVVSRLEAHSQVVSRLEAHSQVVFRGAQVIIASRG